MNIFPYPTDSVSLKFTVYFIPSESVVISSLTITNHFLSNCILSDLYEVKEANKFSYHVKVHEEGQPPLSAAGELFDSPDPKLSPSVHPPTHPGSGQDAWYPRWVLANISLLHAM
jgi:hypothetical protein